MTFQMRKRSDRQRAFTLIELLLVMSIIAILSALGASVLASAEQDALESRSKAGIERISMVLNRKFEANTYRILPARLPGGSTPAEVRQFRDQAMAEFLRVEFPFVFDHVNESEVFPQNQGPLGGPLTLVGQYMPANARPQISSRYFSRLEGTPGGVVAATEENQSAELLHAILSLNFDEFGQPLSAVLHEREIGDTDGDGFFEVLDAFGDPLDFSLVVRFDSAELDALENPVANGLPAHMAGPVIMRNDIADAIGYEVILDENVALDSGQVRGSGPDVGPWPISKYRVTIRSRNLSNTDPGAVVTQ